MASGARARNAEEVRKADHEKELVAMRTYPHHVDPQQSRPTGRPEPDAEPVIPGSLPPADRRGSRTALAMMLVAIAIIVLVVVL